jgi:hypothetical protein
LTKAETIEDLAKNIDVDVLGLGNTVQRFNGFVVKGRDENFGRGDSSYDAFLGDLTYKPNHNLGTIEKGPFYAVKIWPGDLGTKGGVLTDEPARVLTETGGKLEVIKGLYVLGNSSSTVMGELTLVRERQWDQL